MLRRPAGAAKKMTGRARSISTTTPTRVAATNSNRTVEPPMAGHHLCHHMIAEGVTRTVTRTMECARTTLVQADIVAEDLLEVVVEVTEAVVILVPCLDEIETVPRRGGLQL